jgi:nucleoside-diphosphate-sugar epimerase
MRILVFGGTGFLGSALVPRLVESGHTVTVLTRDPKSSARLASMGANALVGDLLSSADISAGLPGVDAMVFIAQPPIFGKRIGARRFASLQDEILRMHQNALALAKQAGCALVLTAGTAYHTTGSEVADETWPLTRTGIARIGDGIDSLLNKARVEGEPRFVRLLPGQIYGPGGMSLKMIEWAEKGRNGIIGSGRNCIPRIHVDDCAEAYVRVVEKLPEFPNGDSFIVADDTPCTSEEFSTELAKLLGMPPPKRVPKLIQLAICLALGKYLFETMQMNCRVSNAKLKRHTGWMPRYPSYREGLKATLDTLARRSA